MVSNLLTSPWSTFYILSIVSLVHIIADSVMLLRGGKRGREGIWPLLWKPLASSTTCYRSGNATFAWDTTASGYDQILHLICDMAWVIQDAKVTCCNRRQLETNLDDNVFFSQWEFSFVKDIFLTAISQNGHICTIITCEIKLSKGPNLITR